VSSLSTDGVQAAPFPRVGRDTARRRVSWRRILLAGACVSVGVLVFGVVLERWRFGSSADTAALRAERYVQSRFDGMIGALNTVSGRLARDPNVASAMLRGEDGARTLFDLTAQARAAAAQPDDIAVTVYDAAFVARAWAGRPSDEIPRERTTGERTLFVTRSPLGLRLVQVQPIVTPDGQRLGSVAAEHAIAPAPPAQAFTAREFTLPTPVGPATLRLRHEVPSDIPRPGARLLRAPSGELLLEASVSEAAVSEARAAVRRGFSSVSVVAAGITVLLLIGPLLDRRAVARDERSYGRATASTLVLAAAGGAIVWLALSILTRGIPGTPATLLFAGFTASAIVALLVGPASRLRVALRARRIAITTAVLRFVLVQTCAGIVVTGLVVLFQRLIDLAVDPVSVDLRHLSLHPWGDGSRVVLLAGVLAIHLAVLWAGTLTLTGAIARWRISRAGLAQRLFALAIWLAPAALTASLAAARSWPLSALGLILSALACGLAALASGRLVMWYRRTTVASRIFALFVAFLLPSLLLYPSLDFFAERATRRLITDQYAVQAQRHPQTLQALMAEAQREIDGLATLPDLVASGAGLAPTPELAFLVWRQTALARERLTSAVELYDLDGGLISRFALNVPEYTVASQTAPAGAACTWDVFGEAAPIGAEERRMLHAERRVCVQGNGGAFNPVGTIVLHVVFDYRTLPFITSQSPYFELFRSAERGAPGESTTGADVEIAIYGWGLQPLYTSRPSAWPIDDALFDRLYRSREPFWTVIHAGGSRHRVYFSNDRAGIFAIGYPVLSVFDHFVHLAELTTLAGAGFVIVLIGTGIFTRIGRQQPRIGRALLREIRASFYRKLFLAFVLASVIPVLILAVLIRVYFHNLLLTDVEAEAARTAAVARRVIEESDVLSRRSADAVDALSDDIMVWIRQVIDQDVNIFVGPKLEVTSERDLFASGLLPTRTPDQVYRAIVLDRFPSFVAEDRIGTTSYLIAAAPVRAAGREALLTIPLAPRQREIDREIDDLDRGVHLGSLFFILLGAAIGLSMAERIADPVRRLTRATRRIARGDFDERIAVRSADELKRLVDAFNSMAAGLKAQRTQLERTHRLEAWAEMARQVAHEIKNPLTPIQLSAEHLQRVHADRGEPMGPVLESCVQSILGQVRLLRQISAEFSNFASSPTARPSTVHVGELVAEVLEPYRSGLAGRVEIRSHVPELPVVFVDRTLVARALANIIENALFAMPSGGALTLDASVDPGFVVLVVADTGVGMDEESLARIFEPYFSTKTTGTGLGLPIARRNIELSGGTIDVRSAKGQGTSVIVRLPIAAGSG
jgi:signal transduction histidine kinase